LEFELKLRIFAFTVLTVNAKAVNAFLDFLTNSQLKISNSFVTFGEASARARTEAAFCQYGAVPPSRAVVPPKGG
jgi:hypothetical protein